MRYVFCHLAYLIRNMFLDSGRDASKKPLLGFNDVQTVHPFNPYHHFINTFLKQKCLIKQIHLYTYIICIHLLEIFIYLHTVLDLLVLTAPLLPPLFTTTGRIKPGRSPRFHAFVARSCRNLMSPKRPAE